MRRFIIGLGLAVATIAVPVVDAAQAVEIAGREGRFAMDYITINGEFSYRPGECVGRYAAPVDGNAFIATTLVQPAATVRVAENRRGVNVTCKFTDESGLYEADAEVGYTDNCILFTEDGSWRNGTGTITAAANNATDGSDGGNAMIRCKFKTGDFTPNP